jgi:hypothetical protein
VRRAAVAALALAALAAGGCIPRLSDPFFAFKGLGAPDAEPGRSLVFGTIELESGLLGPGDVTSVILTRVRPTQEPIRRIASDRIPFRAFRARQVKDGHFLLALEPGAYELSRIVGDALLMPDELAVDEDGRRASRFAITRPAVVDLGVIRIAPGVGLGAYSMNLGAPTTDPARERLLRETIAGTPWERLPVRGVQR